MLPLKGLIFIDTKAYAIKKKRWLVKDKIKLTPIKNIYVSIYVMCVIIEKC